MASTQPQPSKLLARNIVLYSDAELDQYLEANRRLVSVVDPENLPDDFIQRLRVRTGVDKTAQSRPLDLDYVTTRLENISAEREAFPRPPSLASTIIYDDEEMYQHDLERQTEYYNTLVKEGGRPSHPISLGRDITENPGEYGEILSYWQSGSNDWEVFGSQMGKWREFRTWQRKNREEGRFIKYASEVKQDLVEHGFAASFQLDEDPERQDKLTTWIEFLDFEYWLYDKDVRHVKRHQPRYDEAWKKLVDSKVLRPFETQEHLCNLDSAFRHAGERERAEEAVESAEVAVESAEVAVLKDKKAFFDPQYSRELQLRLAAAQSKLDAAIKSHEWIKRRNSLVEQFIRGTRNHRIVKRRVKDCTMLLRWILQQFPLIVLEMDLADVAENVGMQRRSKRNRADVSNEKRVSKRRRHDSQNKLASNNRTGASAAQGGERQVERSLQDSMDQGRASKRPRRNGQKQSLSSHETADAADSESGGGPLSTQPHRSQGTGAAARGAKARKPTPRKTGSEVKTPAKVVLDGKARAMNLRRGEEESSNLSTLGSPRRRGMRRRKPPDRFR